MKRTIAPVVRSAGYFSALTANKRSLRNERQLLPQVAGGSNRIKTRTTASNGLDEERLADLFTLF